jgi:hypothetical protein
MTEIVSSRQRVKDVLAHKQTDKLAIDFGASPVTGIHVRVIEKLRRYYGMPEIPVRLTEPYQMLGEVDPELSGILEVDILGISPRENMFGFENTGWKEFRTSWGQDILVPGMFVTSEDENGDLLIYPKGDISAPPSGRMPVSGFFFDSIIRQEPIDEANLNVEDNLEEFGEFDEVDIEYWTRQAELAAKTDKAVLANFGGTSLGDIALVPGPFLTHPKGIRDVSEWYMSTVLRQDFLHRIFNEQTGIAVKNLETVHGIFSDSIDVVFICGTDFGTQDSQFCSAEDFNELYAPYYKRINDWIHDHTTWKTFKHTCGSINPLLPALIEAGFDIINPVQINARDMDPVMLKREYGDKVTFWGGGIDTQKVLPFGTPDEVKRQVLDQCEILSRGGGFVFNTVHNIQANVPLENVIAMLEAIKQFNGS